MNSSAHQKFVFYIIAGTILFLTLSFFVTFIAITLLKRRQIHAKELAELKHSYDKTLLNSQLEIQEQTLRHISEEIHDNIGQVLSLAKLHLNTLPAPVNPENQEGITHTKELVSQALADLRDLSKSFNTDRVNEMGLEENVRHELEMLQKTRLYQTNLRINGKFYTIPLQTQTILFRMVQEAINNIIKHAKATEVEIIMDYEPTEFCLFIGDNGVGIHHNGKPTTKNGIGLKNMQNRSGVIGASFEIAAGENGGTSVKICLPINA